MWHKLRNLIKINDSISRMPRIQPFKLPNLVISFFCTSFLLILIWIFFFRASPFANDWIRQTLKFITLKLLLCYASVIFKSIFAISPPFSCPSVKQTNLLRLYSVNIFCWFFSARSLHTNSVIYFIWGGKTIKFQPNLIRK